jgi:two-component system KDP operon response regulator KdpE
MTSNRKILVVDDEPNIRFYLKEVLSRDGHQVVTAESGEAALEWIERDLFDLVLLDLRMEGIDGLQVLEILQQQCPETSVIMLTAHASLESAVEALRHGAHDYLFKPCKTVELRESVHRGLTKTQEARRQREVLDQMRAGSLGAGSTAPKAVDQSEAARFLRQGCLIVDLMRHVITLDGHLLELSPTEFDLLAYMVSECPRVTSPKELVREVQGYECDLTEARDVVRYHIYRIRQKIKKATGRSDVIRTVRGVGYTISKANL